MFEFIHAGKFINEWLDSLPPALREKVTGFFFLLIAVVFIFIFYMVARKESIDESGKVNVKWYSPQKWLERYQEIQIENRKKLSPEAIAFTDKIYKFIALGNKVRDFILGLLLALLGLVGVVTSLILNPFKVWWMFLPSALLCYLSYKMLRKPPK